MQPQRWLELAKKHNCVLDHPMTTIARYYVQVFNNSVYLFVEYWTPLGKNTAIHRNDGSMVSDYSEWVSLINKKDEVEA